MNMPSCRHKFKSTHLTIVVTALVAAGLSGALLVLGGCRERVQSADPAPRGGSPAARATPDDRPVLLAFGDSLTAGYGLAPEESYPTLLQRRLDESGYRYRVVNAGVSGDTTAGGLRRLEWSLAEPVSVVILALGGNDGLRGQPVSELRSNLARMIEMAKGRGAKVILAGMEAPPNLGPEYTREFRAAYRELADRYDIPLIPFLLEGVGGRPEFNQPDGIHPNTAGERLLLENVWRILEGELSR
jgi:acyl-CoA thioesterase-1